MGLATIKKIEFEKTFLSHKSSSPGSKADFSKMLVFGIWKLMLSVWHMKLVGCDIIFSIQYIKGPIKNRY